MKKKTCCALIVSVLCLVINNANAQSYYVRAGAIGSNDGSNWTDAWTELPSVLERGATYYIADGEYPDYTFDDPELNDEYIYIKKAVSNDHGTSIGWDNSYGDGFVLFHYLYIKTSNWVIDGSHRTTKDSGHGIKVVIFGDKGDHTQEHGITVANGSKRINNIEIKYVEFTSAFGVYPVGWLDSRDWECWVVKNGYEHTNGGDNVYIGHCYFHHFIGPMQRTRSMNGLIAEHNYYKDNCSYQGGPHGDAIQLWGSSADTLTTVLSQNSIIRYNEFCDIDGTAFINLAWTVSNIHIYGNIFYHSNNDSLQRAVSEIAAPYKGKTGPMYVYNNTMVGADYQKSKNEGSTYFDFDAGSGITTEHYIYNNLWFNCNKAGYAHFENHGYSYISRSTLRYLYEPEITSIISENNPFINWDQFDFHLVNEIGKGLNLNLEPWWNPVYDENLDIDGNIRGSDGIWDIGAYEFVHITVTSVSDVMPSEFSLSQNYPNPFSNSTTITFDAPLSGHYSLKIFDISGREVAILLNSTISAGKQQIEWDCKNSAGHQVGSGVYFYQLKTNNGFMETNKMMLLK
ncbi:MAG: T9SS type A sorting domain-containing protein [Bacteroidales bacterium]